MTPMTIGTLTPAQQMPDVTAPTPEQKKAAREFEAIFIRQLLSSLEKGNGLSGGESSGGSVFRSMMVGALADTAAEAGGIGLSEMILKAMMPSPAQGTPDLSHQGESLDRLPSQMGALRAEEHAAAMPIRSARLGSSSRVLTEARLGTTLLDRGGQPPAVGLSEGNGR
jgi:Rod binding domain-containing protein